MLIIIVTIITQGARVTDDLRGDLQGSMFIRGGITQAIGVISFGKRATILASEVTRLIGGSFCLS